MLNVTERRIELLKLEGIDFEKSEIVKQLTQQFQCSPRNVYYDFQTRKSWQPHYARTYILLIDGFSKKDFLILNLEVQFYRGSF